MAARGGGRGLHTNRTAQLPRELTHSPGFMASYPTTCCAEGKTDRSVNEATSQQRSDAPRSHTSSGFMQDRAGRWVTSSSGRLHQLHGFTSEAHTTWLVAARTTRRSPTPSSPPAAQRSPLGLRALLLSPHPSTGVGGGGWGGFCFPQSAPHPQSSPHRDAVRSVLAGQDEGEAALFPPPPRSSHPSSAARLKKKSSFKHRTQHSPPPPNQRFPTPAGKAKPHTKGPRPAGPATAGGGSAPRPHRAPQSPTRRLGAGRGPGAARRPHGRARSPISPPPPVPAPPQARCPLPAPRSPPPAPPGPASPAPTLPGPGRGEPRQQGGPGGRYLGGPSAPGPAAAAPRPAHGGAPGPALLTPPLASPHHSSQRHRYATGVSSALAHAPPTTPPAQEPFLNTNSGAERGASAVDGRMVAQRRWRKARSRIGGWRRMVGAGLYDSAARFTAAPCSAAVGGTSA